MILENGVIRTMDPTLPSARALAIAADRIAGGVGTHETALPSPERVDLRGRCVVPGFSDSHVHFLSWALDAQRLRLDDCTSLGAALDLLHRERYAEALGQLRELPGGARDPEALLLEAVLLASSSQFAEAEAVCRRLLALDELNAGAHYVLALCDAAAGRPERAVYHDRVAGTWHLERLYD